MILHQGTWILYFFSIYNKIPISETLKPYSVMRLSPVHVPLEAFFLNSSLLDIIDKC